MASKTEWNISRILENSPIAVIILNQPISCNHEFLLPLWEKAAIRITVDGGCNRWRSFIESLPSNVPKPGLPHCASGDFDSITPETKKTLREWGVPLCPTPDQDETDFTKALRLVSTWEKDLNVKVKYVLCLCEHSGRLDQTLANLESLYHAQSWKVDWLPILLTKDSLTWLIPAGKHSIVVQNSNDISKLPCGLIPLKGPATVTTEGLKWNLSKGVLQFGVLVSTSNQYISKTVNIETDSDLIWTMQFTPIHKK